MTFCLITFTGRWRKDDDADGSNEVYVNCMLITQMIQTVLIHIVSFVSYNFEKLDHQSCLNKHIPRLHYTLSMILFIILPVFNLLVYIMMLASSSESGLLFSYMTFYVTLSALILLCFFTILLDDFERLKREHHINNRRRTEVSDNSFTDKFPDDGVRNKDEIINEQFLKLSSHQISKNYKMREDMFSMLFVSAVRPEYKLYCDSRLEQDD